MTEKGWTELILFWWCFFREKNKFYTETLINNKVLFLLYRCLLCPSALTDWQQLFPGSRLARRGDSLESALSPSVSLGVSSPSGFPLALCQALQKCASASRTRFTFSLQAVGVKRPIRGRLKVIRPIQAERQGAGCQGDCQKLGD